MRRLARHIVTVCAAVSLGAGVVAMALWMRTGSGNAELTWDGLRGGRCYHFYLDSGGGDMTAQCVQVPKAFAAADAKYRGLHWTWEPAPSRSRFWSGRFDAHHSVGYGGPNSMLGEVWALWVPQWFAVLGCLPLPLAVFIPRALRRRRLRWRLAARRCTTCGYDLRASPGRCPECGGVRN
jgi:hypothetical protein